MILTRVGAMGKMETDARWASSAKSGYRSVPGDRDAREMLDRKTEPS